MAWGGDDKREKTITKILRLTPSENKKIQTKLNELGGMTFSNYAKYVKTGIYRYKKRSRIYPARDGR